MTFDFWPFDRFSVKYPLLKFATVDSRIYTKIGNAEFVLRNYGRRIVPDDLLFLDLHRRF